MKITFWETLQLSFSSLRHNLVRSLLSSLGVYMGVSAVTATLQVGDITRTMIQAQLAQMQAPQIFIYDDSDGPYYPFTTEDLTYLQTQLNQWHSIGHYDVFRRYLDVFRGDFQAETNLIAVGQNYLQLSGRQLLQGRFFVASDFQKYRPVVIIDQYLADTLFPGVNPLGQMMNIDGEQGLVIGVMDTRVQESWIQDNKDDKPWGETLIPFALLTAQTGNTHFSRLVLSPQPDQDVQQLEAAAVAALEGKYPHRQFFSYATLTEELERKAILHRVSVGLLGVGAIALLVGGVGIANITIASVIERTAEIGLRRAVGATQKDIMAQFMGEAVMMSVGSGLLAVITVNGLVVVLAGTFGFPYSFRVVTNGLAIASAVAVGAGASFLPALRASRLDPVQALRSQ